MSREIRRVVPSWEHPRTAGGNFQPLFDEDFDTASRKWWEAAVRWHDAIDLFEHELAALDDNPWYWQWDGDPPDQDYYRPAWAKPTHYQMYETVSEGTPISPIFATLAELEDWLVEDGFWDALIGRETMSGEYRDGNIRHHRATRADPGYYSERCSREAARAFCASGRAMSAVIDRDGYHANLEGSAVLAWAKDLDSGDGA